MRGVIPYAIKRRTNLRELLSGREQRVNEFSIFAFGTMSKSHDRTMRRWLHRKERMPSYTNFEVMTKAFMPQNLEIYWVPCFCHRLSVEAVDW